MKNAVERYTRLALDDQGTTTTQNGQTIQSAVETRAKAEYALQVEYATAAAAAQKTYAIATLECPRQFRPQHASCSAD